MEEKIIARLTELRENQQKGLAILTEKRRELAELEQTLLRIAGAIQALEELANVVDIEDVKVE